jgi:hypothetical protein
MPFLAVHGYIGFGKDGFGAGMKTSEIGREWGDCPTHVDYTVSNTG